MLKHRGGCCAAGGRATKERGWRERASEMKNACWFIQQAFFYYYFDYFERAMMKVATDMRALARLIQIEVLAEMKALRASILRGST